MERRAQRGKKGVDLSGGGAVRSRIRRDPPPPPVKLLTPEELRRREAWTVAIGITLFSLTLFVILIAFSKGPGWTPGEITIVLRDL